MWRRFIAVFRARLPEFYRDKASLTWNILMPLVLVAGFAFVFSDEPETLFKVGVYGEQPDMPFLETAQVRFIEIDDLTEAKEKLRRHQYDLLLDLSDMPRYWVNNDSPQGAVVENLLLGSAAQPNADTPVRETVVGSAISYADWLLPGILAMNVMFSCLWGVGWVVVRYRKNGVLRRLHATPLTAFEFLAAQVATRLLVVMSVTVLVYIAARLLIDVTMNGSHALLFLTFFIGAACLTSVGLLVATRLRTEELADGLLNLMSWPQLILSGVWFSLEGVNPAARAIAEVLPLTHLVDAARRIMIDGASFLEVLPQLGLLLGLTGLLLGVSALLFRWN